MARSFILNDLFVAPEARGRSRLNKAPVGRRIGALRCAGIVGSAYGRQNPACELPPKRIELTSYVGTDCRGRQLVNTVGEGRSAKR